jgi:hypothetical protein
MFICQKIHISFKIRKLIKEDERLAKILSDLRQQHDQLDATKINTKNFNDLTKQKVENKILFIVIVILNEYF